MIRYLNKRLVLGLAGLFFMIPLLGKPLLAKRLGKPHPPMNHHKPAPDDDPCTEMMAPGTP